MPDVDPGTLMPKWPRTPISSRIQECRVMLHLHGFLTDAENARLKARIERWLRANAKKDEE